METDASNPTPPTPRPPPGSVWRPPGWHRRPQQASWAGRGWWLLVLLLLIVALAAPHVARQISYSIALGRMQAEAQVAREHLAEARPVSISEYRWIVKAMEPSVVGVKARRLVEEQPSDELSAIFGDRPQYRAQDEGSGVIIDKIDKDKEGFIVTNYHVVCQAGEVNVDLADGRVVPAKIVGTDKLSDLAVLQIHADGLEAARWGDSDKLEVGDPVLAIGNPFGLVRTVTAGIISGKGRHNVMEDLNYQDFLQTDAAVNPGNSGGPLVDMQGRVVGINTAIVGPAYQGIGFAIPSNLAKEVCQTLKAAGKVSRGWLGVATLTLTPERAKQIGLADANGALVTGVLRDSPAAAAIVPGDVIVRWNDRPINDPMELGLAVAATKPGSTATVELIRDGAKKTITVRVRERPARAG
jgi:serine protease Do